MARYARHTLRSGKYSNGIVRRRGIGRYVFLGVIIFASIIGLITLFKIIDNKNYEDEASFIEYAERHFAEAKDSDKLGELQEKYDYGKPSSVAMNYPKIGSDFIDKEVKTTVERRKADFLSQHEEDPKNEKYALLVSTDTYSSDKTDSIVLKTVEKEENEAGKLIQTYEKVDVLTFDKESKSKIYPIMVFEVGYQEKLSKYFEEFLKEEYDDVLGDDYKKYLDPKENKFDKFALDGDEAVFFFDSGTLTNDGKALTIKVDKSDIKDLFRSETNSRKIDVDKPMVAITYDDGPSSTETAKILDTLEQEKVVATFFEIGKNVDQVKDSSKLLKRMDSLGCEIGSHTYTHRNLLRLTDEELKEENEKTDIAIEKAVGYVPYIYRPPYGSGSDKTNEVFGKASILWSVDTEDWKNRTKEAVVDSVKSRDDLDGHVILMHSIYPHTAEATKELIPWLKEKGYQLVTVSELITYKFNEDPKQIRTFGGSFFTKKGTKK